MFLLFSNTNILLLPSPSSAAVKGRKTNNCGINLCSPILFGPPFFVLFLAVFNPFASPSQSRMAFHITALPLKPEARIPLPPHNLTPFFPMLGKEEENEAVRMEPVVFLVIADTRSRSKDPCIFIFTSELVLLLIILSDDPQHMFNYHQGSSGDGEHATCVPEA
ncbi:uncharacterized protein LACBIDRAFT_329775 [Laccaria bicolor S238N-H82]|uniref:Predicted protein n=1 Tax=Laccaria bicolor (strain S238N-H82 / ATCC MYA-4686) TaxID=486041 RepID=B0DJ73_LACBS|nr:uncharacterized protein LACBIDRAFT_329775 [Laccaria bicolor S238N-H82]EDR05356.1 predicted protein [Laccaria bicolor S238N-H82]|eukprot:XP_001883914.1 predicted protein [Laccaria bicolor S238N-H82]